LPAQLKDELQAANKSGSAKKAPLTHKTDPPLQPFKMKPITELDIYYGRGTDGSFFLPKDDEPDGEEAKKEP